MDCNKIRSNRFKIRDGNEIRSIRVKIRDGNEIRSIRVKIRDGNEIRSIRVKIRDGNEIRSIREIGRASCRERVKITVEAGSIKKKRQTNNKSHRHRRNVEQQAREKRGSRQRIRTRAE